MRKKFVQFVSLLLALALLPISSVIATPAEMTTEETTTVESATTESVPSETTPEGTTPEETVTPETVPEETPPAEPTPPVEPTPVEPTPPPIPVEPTPDEEPGTMIRVGLCYESTALDGANLENSVGSGFRFGYFNSNNQFLEVANTEQTKISVIKTSNVYFGNYNDYTSYHEELATSNVVVGCYHVQLGTYATYAEAAQVALQYTNGFVAYIGGLYCARVGNYPERSGAEILQAELSALGVGAEIVGTSSFGVSVVITGTNTILFQFDDQGTGTGFGIKAKPRDSAEKTITWFKKYKWYGGFRYERINGGDLTVVNVVSLEDYVRGILPYEMSNAWPLEALKAQAVCARSYTMNNINRHSSGHFDICNADHCQVYYGVNSANETTDRAVDETAGQFAWYNGNIIQAYYHSSDGGATDNCENVWTSSLPYLRGVIDPYEALVEDKIPNYRWSTTYTGKQLQERFAPYGYVCAEIVDIRVSKTTETGNVYSVSFTDANGKTWTVSKDKFVRSMMGVRSLRYTIVGGGDGYSLTNDEKLMTVGGAWVLDGNGNLSQLPGEPVYAITGTGIEQVTGPENTTGTFTFTGSGRGHNLGMSQWGAYSMATQGYTYEDILKFYFTGIEIY